MSKNYADILNVNVFLERRDIYFNSEEKLADPKLLFTLLHINIDIDKCIYIVTKKKRIWPSGQEHSNLSIKLKIGITNYLKVNKNQNHYPLYNNDHQLNSFK